MGSGNPWLITRRGVDYTVTATVCTLDSPADGIESTGPGERLHAAARRLARATRTATTSAA